MLTLICPTRLSASTKCATYAWTGNLSSTSSRGGEGACVPFRLFARLKDTFHYEMRGERKEALLCAIQKPPYEVFWNQSIFFDLHATSWTQCLSLLTVYSYKSKLENSLFWTVPIVSIIVHFSHRLAETYMQLVLVLANASCMYIFRYSLRSSISCRHSSSWHLHSCWYRHCSRFMDSIPTIAFQLDFLDWCTFINPINSENHGAHFSSADLDSPEAEVSVS